MAVRQSAVQFTSLSSYPTMNQGSRGGSTQSQASDAPRGQGHGRPPKKRPLAAARRKVDDQSRSVDHDAPVHAPAPTPAPGPTHPAAQLAAMVTIEAQEDLNTQGLGSLEDQLSSRPPSSSRTRSSSRHRSSPRNAQLAPRASSRNSQLAPLTHATRSSSCNSSQPSRPQSVTDLSRETSSEPPTKRTRAPKTAMAPPPLPAAMIRPSAAHAPDPAGFEDVDGEDLSVLYEEEVSVQDGHIQNLLGALTDDPGDYLQLSILFFSLTDYSSYYNPIQSTIYHPKRPTERQQGSCQR